MRNWSSDELKGTPLLSSEGGVWSGAELTQRVEDMVRVLNTRSQPKAAVGILADNSAEWIVVDLAAHAAGVALVPLPSFFTFAQWQHIIEAAGIQSLFCKQSEHAAALGFHTPLPWGSDLLFFERPGTSSVELAGIQKITFTSGTTSQPKGVCLSSAQQWELASVLQTLLADLHIERHLNLLPLPVLLENIAGVYTALLSGAVNICLPLAQTGLSGASQFDPVICLDAISKERAESIILLPQMLQALVAVAGNNDPRIRTLKFVAVGGAKTPAALIAAARAKGFPVYEGYGLSECGSVVSLNRPDADSLGSVGKPLPNRRVRVAEDGEIEVEGGGMVGYLGMEASPLEWLPTGDLGHLDEEGFLHIDGRKKNVLVSAYGRNISPEWPESALLGTGVAAQVAVFGDARPYLVAAIVPAHPGVTQEQIQASVEHVNQALPDYARIRRWFLTTPFTTKDGTATANGRVRREAAVDRCFQQIELAYQNGD